jgi:hypothetical protein
LLKNAIQINYGGGLA